MRLGFVTCQFPPDFIGGAQMQSMRLCEALSKENDVIVFTRTYDRNGTGRRKEGGYILQSRRAIKLPVIKSLIDIVKVLYQIRCETKATRIYISFQIQLAALIVVFAKFLFGTKAIVSPRGFEDFDFKWYKKVFQKFIYLNADTILIQSESIKKAFFSNLRFQFSSKKQKQIQKKIKIFPNGISVPTHQPSKLSSRSKQIIFVGRLEPIKGLTILLEALKLYNEKIHLQIVGDGSQRGFLESYSKGMNVSFLGKRSTSEIELLLKNARLLVLPSLSENFPNVILEAFCEGVPVIASNVGAIPELIDDGVNGYLFQPGNPQLLAEKIDRILSEEEKLNEMGRAAYQKVLNYDWPYLVKEFDSVIDKFPNRKEAIIQVIP